MATEQPQSALSKFPTALARVLNDPEDGGIRDSAYASGDAASKHTSNASSIGLVIIGPNSSTAVIAGTTRVPSDKTPSPSPIYPNGSTVVSPTTSMSINSMVSHAPATPGIPPPRFDRPSFDSYPPVPSINGSESRRESFDSRISQPFQQMGLGSSPYASLNHSTTSIAESLASQRNPRIKTEGPVHRISNGYHPNAERTPDGHPKIARTAPAITGPATSTIARAAEPTKGQAWAFPEEEIQRLGPVSSNVSSTHDRFLDSRRSSISESIASSQFTTESRLPAGQRRLEDGLGPDFIHSQRLSNASSEYPPSHHHHSLQHRQLTDLHSEEHSPQSGAQPYSRTPELRVSHKLAERKRRTEMKELFEQLRDMMPQERGSKASKWEILTKAISEHQRLLDTVKSVSGQLRATLHEKDMACRELERVRMENAQLRAHPSAAVSPNHPPSAGSAQPSQEPYNTNVFQREISRPELPSLRSLNNGTLPSGPDSMTGVQYDGQRPAENSFR